MLTVCRTNCCRKSGLSTAGVGGSVKPHLWEEKHTRRRSLQQPPRQADPAHWQADHPAGVYLLVRKLYYPFPLRELQPPSQYAPIFTPNLTFLLIFLPLLHNFILLTKIFSFLFSLSSFLIHIFSLFNATFSYVSRMA
jgi:hypothetical protein